jgi:hypothetical protein
MPTVLRIGPYRFQFFAADISEPPHVHVKRDKSHAKFWLSEDVAPSFVRGFADHDATYVRKLIVQNREFLLEQWNEFFRGHPR